MFFHILATFQSFINYWETLKSHFHGSPLLGCPSHMAQSSGPTHSLALCSYGHQASGACIQKCCFPETSSLKKWCANLNCSTGFYQKVTYKPKFLGCLGRIPLPSLAAEGAYLNPHPGVSNCFLYGNKDAWVQILYSRYYLLLGALFFFICHLI